MCRLPRQSRQLQPLEGQEGREEQLRSIARLREGPAPQTDHEALRQDDQETNITLNHNSNGSNHNNHTNNIYTHKQNFNVILHYASISYDNVFNKLSSYNCDRLDVVYRAGQIGVDTLVFIKKNSGRKHPDYKMDGIAPLFFVLKHGGEFTQGHHLTMEVMIATMAANMSNFTFTDTVKEGELFDPVFDKFRCMSDDQRVTIKGQGKLKSIPTKDLNDEQGVFLKCYDDFIVKIKALKNTHGAGIAWSAHSPPSTTVVAPLSELVNLEQEINNITTTTNNNSNVNTYCNRRGLDTTKSPGRGLPTSSRTSSPTRTTSSFAMASSSSVAIASHRLRQELLRQDSRQQRSAVHRDVSRASYRQCEGHRVEDLRGLGDGGPPAGGRHHPRRAEALGQGLERLHDSHDAQVLH